MKQQFKNRYAMPTRKLTEIVGHPYTQGIDGKDYNHLKQELEQELWARQNAETERLMQQHDKDQKDYFKHLASAHKRAKGEKK